MTVQSSSIDCVIPKTSGFTMSPLAFKRFASKLKTSDMPAKSRARPLIWRRALIKDLPIVKSDLAVLAPSSLILARLMTMVTGSMLLIQSTVSVARQHEMNEARKETIKKRKELAEGSC